jgi:hypothetical protein
MLYAPYGHDMHVVQRSIAGVHTTRLTTIVAVWFAWMMIMERRSGPPPLPHGAAGRLNRLDCNMLQFTMLPPRTYRILRCTNTSDFY